MSIYMIQNNHADWTDNARAGDTIDTMDEEYGYFTTSSEAKAFAAHLQEQEDGRHRKSFEEGERKRKEAIESNNADYRALVAAGLRPDSAVLRGYSPYEYVRPWHATTYTVLEIHPHGE